METGSAANEVVIRCSHHWSLNGHSLLVIAHFVVHEGPDPQGSLIVGAKIVTSHVLLAKLVVVSLGSFAESLIGPLDGRVVALSAPVANLVILVEISKLNSAMELNLLARAELSLDLRGGDGVVSSVELVEEVILILGHGDGLDLTWLSRLLVTSSCHRWEMNWVD